ncbi:aminotransferase class I/II-fold pyridoxal phosphate-dependent enzyme [Ruminococcaceae bacterium OttesenSCG-928-N02]|nr:aminotransferase class I/II-fold pyridoxal phosphate-dependent enzyme [Ruminococcaceae bacterium OttesenSCG-928-N02]
MMYNFDRTLDHRQTKSMRWLQPQGRDDILGMGTADLDFTCPPSVRAATLAISEENAFNYHYKPEAYYEAVTGWFARKYGCEIQREWMSTVPGTLAAIQIAIRTFSRTGEYVLMQTPYFSPLRDGIEGAGRHFLENPMILQDGRYELDLLDFEEKIRRYKPALFLLVNPQNPTGRIFTIEELQQMVDICAHYGVRIISDEVHFLITYDGKKHVPIYEVSQRARDISILIFSYSKGFNLMSLPNAIAFVANKKMRDAWEKQLAAFNFNYASNSFAVAAVTAVAGGTADAWLEQLTAYLQSNRDYFMKAVQAKNLPLVPLKPEASYLFWVDCRNTGIPSKDLDRAFFDRAGIALNNGLAHGADGRGFVRLNFGVTRHTLETAVERMEKMFTP